MIYEFRDTRTNNLMDAFDSEHEALLALCEVFRMQGRGAVEHLMLIEDDPSGAHSRVMAVGVGLIYRALASAITPR